MKGPLCHKKSKLIKKYENPIYKENKIDKIDTL